jgi:hypothetical protein
MRDLQALNRLRAVRGLGPVGTKDNSDQKRETAKKEKKSEKKKKRINKVGEDRKATNKILKNECYPMVLKRDPICKIQSPVCTRISTVVNHTEGRGKDVILDVNKMEGCCPPCNGFIEEHPNFNGGQHKKPRHHKKTQA